jgi:pimeloyl-ACP methyl ester carboxylesterase
MGAELDPVGLLNGPKIAISAPVAGGIVQSVETRYARIGRDRIAYQTLGHGPPDLVFTFGSYSHVDIAWEDPGIALFLRALASFSRLILFDRRGTGASDPVLPDAVPPWEGYAEELNAVLDEVGSEQTAIMAQLDAGPLALYFAAARPERTSALILAHTTAKFVAADDYPVGVSAEAAEALLAQFDQLWGSGALAGILMPSRAGDARFRRWFAKVQRTGASPRVVQALLRASMEVDARPILRLIHAPTLILHRRDVRLIPVQQARFLAEHIPHARLVELPGADLSLIWETRELALDLIEEFLTGIRRVPLPRRVLATVLFTDIVDSTRRAGRLGDRRWRKLLDVHDELTRRVVRSSRASWSRPPVTAFWPPSMARDGGSAAPRPCGMSCEGSVCRSERACTPARSNSGTAMSAASACTSRLGSSPRPSPIPGSSSRSPDPERGPARRPTGGCAG